MNKTLCMRMAYFHDFAGEATEPNDSWAAVTETSKRVMICKPVTFSNHLQKSFQKAKNNIK